MAPTDEDELADMMATGPRNSTVPPSSATLGATEWARRSSTRPTFLPIGRAKRLQKAGPIDIWAIGAK